MYVYWSSYAVPYPLFLSDFNDWIFSTGFRKILKYQISWKSFQWEQSYSMGTDTRIEGQTDITKLTVFFFAILWMRLKKELSGICCTYWSNKRRIQIFYRRTWTKNIQAEEPGIDGKVILQRFLEKWDVKMWNGFIWFKVWSSGALLCAS